MALGIQEHTDSDYYSHSSKCVLQKDSMGVTCIDRYMSKQTCTMCQSDKVRSINQGWGKRMGEKRKTG